MRDTDADVRGDAVSALSQMAEHCTEGLAEYHAQVVPALIHVLQDKAATQQQALFALETLCEDLGACRPQWAPQGLHASMPLPAQRCQQLVQAPLLGLIL